MEYDPNFFWDLGNGDYRGYTGPIETTIKIKEWDGLVHLIFVPKDGDLSKGRVFHIDINTQYQDQGAILSAGGSGVSSGIVTCSLDSTGLNIALANVPKSTCVITHDGEFVARILFGDEGEVNTLKALPVPFGGEYSDGRVGIFSVEGNDVFLSIVPEDTIKVYGFNLLDEDVTPKVVGDEASSGVMCDVVGGDYGINVTMPPVDFDNCYIFEKGYWLEVAEI